MRKAHERVNKACEFGKRGKIGVNPQDFQLFRTKITSLGNREFA